MLGVGRRRKKEDELPDESLFLIAERSWFADIANFKVAGIIPKANWPLVGW